MSDELLRFGDVTIAVRASSESTGGALSLFEELPAGRLRGGLREDGITWL